MCKEDAITTIDFRWIIPYYYENMTKEINYNLIDQIFSDGKHVSEKTRKLGMNCQGEIFLRRKDKVIPWTEQEIIQQIGKEIKEEQHINFGRMVNKTAKQSMKEKNYLSVERDVVDSRYCLIL